MDIKNYASLCLVSKYNNNNGSIGSIYLRLCITHNSLMSSLTLLEVGGGGRLFGPPCDMLLGEGLLTLSQA